VFQAFQENAFQTNAFQQGILEGNAFQYDAFQNGAFQLPRDIQDTDSHDGVGRVEYYLRDERFIIELASAIVMSGFLNNTRH